MFLRTSASILALLAAASAHPHHRVSGDHLSWRSWPQNSSLPIGSLGASGFRSTAQVASATPSSTSQEAFGTTTVHGTSTVYETSTVAPWHLTDASATSVGDLCVPLTTTKTVVVYETVIATAASPAPPSAEPTLEPVSTPSTPSPSTTSFVAKIASSASSVASPPSPVAITTSASSPSSPAVTTEVHTSSSAVTASDPVETSTPATPSNSSKRGVIANPIPGVVAPFTKYEKISWDMNWWHGTPPEQPGNWQFVPQLTHPQPDQWWPHADFRYNVSEFPYIFSFLEPDGHVSVADAVQSWKTNLEPLAKSHTLVPPMVGQEGLSWLQEFTAACTGCTLDKGPIAFTIYASPDEGGVADFKNHLSQFKAAYPGRELWAANVGPLGTPPDSDSEWLMRQLIPYLENEPAVTRYAWNGDKSFWDDSTGNLTPLAQLYATL